MIQAARADESVRALLGLPEKIRQEDGSRDAFEAVFQMIDADDSKTVYGLTQKEFTLHDSDRRLKGAGEVSRG